MFALVAVASGAMLLWPLVQKVMSGVSEIGTLDATRLINRNNALLLDLRETKEFEGGKLPNAVHVPLSQLKERGSELARFTKRPVIAYCARGNTSRAAGATLKQLGFAEIYQLQGGLQGWKSAGLPLETI